MKTIAYYGIPGAFSHITAVREFGNSCSCNYQSAQSFKQVFAWVNEGVVDYGIVPLENSLAGSVYENYDNLSSHDVCIMSEHYTRIELCLASLPCPDYVLADRLKQIRQVLSHPKALEQCAVFFENHPWMEAIMFHDTARAAEEVAWRGDLTCAALCNKAAAERHHLEILQSNVEDDARNYTRFISIAKRDKSNLEGDKCSLVMQVKHTPGSLVQALSVISEHGFNLCKIESRPQAGSKFEYLFYIDFENVHASKQQLQAVLDELKGRTQSLNMLGLYKRGDLWTS